MNVELLAHNESVTTIRKRRPNPLPGLLALIVVIAVIVWTVANEMHQ